MVISRRQTAAGGKSNPAVQDDTISTDSSVVSDITERVASNESDTQPVPENSKEKSVVPRSGKKWGVDFWKRLFTGLFLSAGFASVINSGHISVFIGVIIMEIGMYREVLRLGLRAGKGSGPLPLWLTIGWYFFWACQFLFYGKAVLVHFEDQKQPFMSNWLLQNALKHHTFWSFCMYCAGFVGFVLSLRQDQYHRQFSYFGRTLVALLLVVVQSHFMILNVTQGLIWFILPSSLIIVNDSFAYFCGRMFGKHSLTALSPKKTWEGYLGAGVFTVIAAYFLSGLLSRYPSLVCPVYSFSQCTFWACPKLACDPLPYAFIPKVFSFTPLPWLSSIVISFSYRPVQLHSIALGLFAAAVGPFGGFFASGAKRAFDIKDFANLFPGHGGVTDRVDCQLLMAIFTYVYVINFVQVNFVGSPDVGKVMSFVADLSTSEQIQLMREIYSRLRRRGVGEDELNFAAMLVP